MVYNSEGVKLKRSIIRVVQVVSCNCCFGVSMNRILPRKDNLLGRLLHKQFCHIISAYPHQNLFIHIFSATYAHFFQNVDMFFLNTTNNPHLQKIFLTKRGGIININKILKS